MLILSTRTVKNGARQNTWIRNPPDDFKAPEGWIEVPENLEADVLSALPFLELKIEHGVLVGITPTERPEPEPVPYVPTTEDRLSALESAMLSMMGVSADV